ncbi:uncharacterized protein LAJ45_07432 [Morchella importuna]|uniref:uncharacterized protein n=1 Tax=Morchella importuna TaxID=1174673 RepID=UPI001E8E9DA6|nr:uncharacterized protein LAJ45_07432 [Morchella importuna]KAH8148331.1 hypothetical protein LAJ45_07432 [Morchella importuna]
MSSTTPPTTPLSISSKPSRLDSPARIALAIKLLQTKPPSLSIREFIDLLRSHTFSGERALDPASEQRHIKACRLWRERSEADADRVHELQAKVNELTEKIVALSKANESVSHEAGLVKRKGKAVNKRKSVSAGNIAKPVENQSGTSKILQDPSQNILPEGGDFVRFSGSAISKLISSLYLLQFAREPHLVPRSIEQTSQALYDVVQDFIDGKLTKAISPAELTYGTKESQEIEDISKIVGKTCDKAISSLGYLIEEGGKTINTRNKEFLASGIGSVIQMLVGILSLIYKTTRRLLSEGLYPTDKPATRDIRLELTTILVRLLKTLSAGKTYQRDILEGLFYRFLEIINGTLSQPDLSYLDEANEDMMVQRLAVEETSWYFLRVFQAVLKVKNHTIEPEERKLERQAMERLKFILIDGIFCGTSNVAVREDGGERKEKGKRKKDDREGFWESLETKQPSKNITVTDSAFSNALWELLGFDMLAEQIG